MKIDKSVNVKKMNKNIKQLERQGLKQGVDFDVIKEWKTHEEMLDKLSNNRFIREDLINIGRVKKPR